MRRALSLLLLIVAALAAPLAMADTKADARRYFQRGMAYIDRGEYELGIRELKRAYEIRPHRNVLFNIARAYASLGDVSSAISHFEQYLAESPPDAERVRSTLEELRLRQQLRSLVEEGMAAIRSKRYMQGVALLERAYEQRPHPNILFNIGRGYEDAGELRRALDAYRRYLRSGPRDATDVRRRIARIEAQLGEGTRDESLAARPKAPPPVTDPKKKPPAPVPGRAPEAPLASAPPDEQSLERFAELLVARLRQEGALPPVAEPPSSPDPAPGSLAEPPEGAPVVAVRVDPSSTSTATLDAEEVDLEAKGGEAYQEVVVTASRRAQSPLDAPNAVTIITEEDIRLSGARTIPDLLRRVPGMDVMAMSYSDYNVAVRGFNRRIANKILVLIDGRTAYQDFVGGTLWRSFSIDLLDIERIEVVRGPGSAIYGAYAYTGIINIITKRPEQVGGSVVQVGAGNGRRLESAYQYGARHGPVGVKVSVGYERGDKFDMEFDPSRVDYTTNVADPTKSLDIARIDVATEYELGKEAGRFFLGGGGRSGFSEFYGVAALRNQAVEGQEMNLRGGFESDLLTVRAFWNRLSVTSTPQFYRTGLSDLGSRVRFDLVSFEPVFRPEFDLLGHHALVIGGEYRHKFIDWDYLNGRQTEDHFALFFQDAWSMGERVTTILSARLDLHPLIGPLGSPRAAVIYKPAPDQAIRVSVGTAFRQPTMAETYLALAASSPVAGVAVNLVGGGRELRPEAIATLDVGYRIEKPFGDFEAVAFVNRVSSLISRTPLVPTGIDQSFRPDLDAFVGAQSFYVNDPRVFLALGGEISTRLYPVDGVDLGFNYAAQYIVDTESGERFTDSPIHKVTGWAQIRTRLGLDVALSGHFVSAQQWIEPNYDPNAPSGFNTDPLPIGAAVVVIGRLGYRMLEDRLEFGVSGVNLLDFGGLRHREHPYANRLEARVLGTVTARF